MQAAQALSANTTTFLTHIFGRGLADERYVVERFHSRVDGDTGSASARRFSPTRSSAGSACC